MASNSNSSHPPPQSNGSTGPSRVPKEEFSWLCTLLVTLSIILFLCLLTWFILSRDNDPLPKVTLHDFSISKFQTLDSRLVAEWVAKFTISVHVYDVNPGSAHPVFVAQMTFEYIESFVSYKGHILVVNSTNIGKNESEIIGLTTISIKFSTEGLEGDQREVQDWVLEDIRKDRDNGTVIFGMQLVMWTPRYRRSYWARCSDLMVDFNKPKWVATLDLPKDCYVSKWNRTLHSLY